MSFGRERRHLKNALEINTDIVVSELAMNRATEVKNFTNELNRYYGNRTVHQSVPRHLRRRQASHYPHVLPYRFVKSAILEKKRCESEMKGNKTAAQKMQKKIEETTQALFDEKIEVSHGGGAVKLVMNGHSELQSINLDPEFLKEDKATIEATILAAVVEATEKTKALHKERMQSATAGFTLGMGM
jgi:DNA-binding YbaB/EbfC family protein